MELGQDPRLGQYQRAKYAYGEGEVVYRHRFLAI